MLTIAEHSSYTTVHCNGYMRCHKIHIFPNCNWCKRWPECLIPLHRAGSSALRSVRWICSHRYQWNWFDRCPSSRCYHETVAISVVHTRYFPPDCCLLLHWRCGKAFLSFFLCENHKIYYVTLQAWLLTKNLPWISSILASFIPSLTVWSPTTCFDGNVKSCSTLLLVLLLLLLLL